MAISWLLIRVCILLLASSWVPLWMLMLGNNGRDWSWIKVCIFLSYRKSLWLSYFAVKLDRLKKLHLEPKSEGLYELFIVVIIKNLYTLSIPKWSSGKSSQDTPRGKICMTNTELYGEKAYATNDLLIRHPTNPKLWKVHGRSDDQIVHSTGEKVGILLKHIKIIW